MSSIDSVHQIVASIRTAMAARVSAGAPGAPQMRPKRGARIGADNAAAQQQRMGAMISTRVKALDPADPNRGRKAFRIFLESVLLAELGEQLINDPAFYHMVDDVQRAMEQDAQISAAIAKAVASLLAAQSGGH